MRAAALLLLLAACPPSSADPRVRAVAESAERIPTGYNPHTGDIFSVADGGE